MHTYQVPPAAVCIEEVLAHLSTRKAMHSAFRENRVAMYRQLLRAEGRIDCAPLLVRQNQLGYLEAIQKQDGSVNAYVIACYLSGKPVEVITRKPLRPAPWFRSERDGTVLPECAVSSVATD